MQFRIHLRYTIHTLFGFFFSLNKPIRRLQVIENNAKWHGAKTNKEISLAFEVQKLSLPASSPDLNFIENVWHIFKQRLQMRFSKYMDKWPHSENELREVIEEEWKAIHQVKIHRLVDSMALRLQAIIDAGGSHIKW